MTSEYRTSKAIVRVHRPRLSDTEYAAQADKVRTALQQYWKATGRGGQKG